jgi:hypothetical protein
MISGAA